MPPVTPAAQITPQQQASVAPSLRSEQLISRAAGPAAPEAEDTGAEQPAAASAEAPDETMETPDETEPEDIQTQMNQDRFLRANAQRTAQQQAQTQQAAQALVMAVGKSPWGRAILVGIKYIIKIINFAFGQGCVAILVTAWIVSIPLNLLFFWLPIFGALIAYFFGILFAVPLSSVIWPKVKPYVDEIVKQTSILPKAAEMKGAGKLPGRP